LWSDWRRVFGNRSFVLFSAAMVGSYVLAYQIYLALPLETRRITGDGFGGEAAVSGLFVASAVVAILGQVSITAWCKRCWSTGTCLVVGLGVMGGAFAVPVLLDIVLGPLVANHAALAAATQVVALLAAAAVLALGTVIVFPFEMDTIVALSGGRLVATHYGLYNTICGVGILAGNLLIGTLLDLARQTHLAPLPWLCLAIVGAACAMAVRRLDRNRRLAPENAEALTAA